MIPDPWRPEPVDLLGFVDDMGSIHMHWDNGRTLALIPGEDSFRKLTPEEIAQEQAAQEQQVEGMECQTL